MHDLQKKREQAEAYFRKSWSKQSQENVSDFGAYCVEKWLEGRHPGTSYYHLGIDFLRSHAYRTGVRGSSDLLCQPDLISKYTEFNPNVHHGANSAELGRYVESSLLRDRRLSLRHRIALILYYEWGFNLKEIGDVLGVSEARASQVLSQAMSIQKTRIQAADTSAKERDRQRTEQKKISREIQNRFDMDEKAAKILERIRKEKGYALEHTETKEVQEDLLRAFAVSTF